MKPNLKDPNGKISLNWSQLGAVISGVSAVDLKSLAIRKREDALEFAQEYGFNLQNPDDLERVKAAHEEAIQFIESYFLDPEDRDQIDPDVRYPEHILDLLIYSSSYMNKSNLKQKWACAVLKVMHAIFHIDLDIKLKYFDQARMQIFDSFEKLLCEEDGKMYLAWGDQAVPLYAYHRKRNKDRHSILLKLLHKPDYVASDIYDHIGMRLVFHTRLECLIALKLLRRSHLISPTSVKPFRSRNSLIDLSYLKKIFSKFRAAFNRANHYPKDILKEVEKELVDQQVQLKGENPFSSVAYRAIQVTVRKLLKVDNPLFASWIRMNRMVMDLPETLRQTQLNELNQIRPEKFIQFYFDYEIQIQDLEAYLDSEHGPASHKAYKQRQTEAARLRVLGKDLIQHLEGQQVTQVTC